MSMRRKDFTPKQESDSRNRRSTMKSHSFEYITRNPTNIEEAELRDCISNLVDSGILINKKTKKDLDSLFVNKGTSTDITP